MTVILYHGTLAKSVDQIRAEGLRPPMGVNPWTWYMLTTSKGQAARYTGPRPEAVVIEYHLTPEQVDQYLGKPTQHDVYDFVATAYGIAHGPLPGSLIAAVHPVEMPTKAAAKVSSINYQPEVEGDEGIIFAMDGDLKVGQLEWGMAHWGGHEGDHLIKMVEVASAYQRQGIASEMLRLARSLVPYEIKHSPSRSESGEAWSQAVGSIQTTAGPINSLRAPTNTPSEGHVYHHAIVGKNGKTYYIASGNWYDTIIAFTEDPYDLVGELTSWNWNGRREIYKVQVDAKHRRQGIASAMLSLAREGYPDLAHAQPVALSDDGRAWSQAVESKTVSGPRPRRSRASRVEAGAAHDVYAREMVVRDMVGNRYQASVPELEKMLQEILAEHNIPGAENACIQEGSDPRRTNMGIDYETRPPYPFIALGSMMRDRLTLVHEASHIIDLYQQGTLYEVRQRNLHGHPDDTHGPSFLAVYEPLLWKYLSVRLPAMSATASQSATGYYQRNIDGYEYLMDQTGLHPRITAFPAGDSSHAVGRMEIKPSMGPSIGGKPTWEIDWVSVDEGHQRKGIAKNMLEFMRDVYGQVVHSEILTPDGEGWSAHVGAKTATKADEIRGYLAGLDLPEQARDGDCIPVSGMVLSALKEHGMEGNVVNVVGYTTFIDKPVLAFAHMAVRLAEGTIVDATATQFDFTLPSLIIQDEAAYIDMMTKATHADSVKIYNPGQKWAKTARREVYYHGTFRKLPPGTILRPSGEMGAATPVWGYGTDQEGTKGSPWVWMTDDPRRARNWGSDGAWSYGYHQEGMSGDEAHELSRQVFVYAVEPMGRLESHPEMRATDYTADAARVLYEVDERGIEMVASKVIYYHGTQADLPIGTLLVPSEERGIEPPYDRVRERIKKEHPEWWNAFDETSVWMTNDLGIARYYATKDGHIYVVEPIGEICGDSDGHGHTFATKSCRVIGEVDVTPESQDHRTAGCKINEGGRTFASDADLAQFVHGLLPDGPDVKVGISHTSLDGEVKLFAKGWVERDGDQWHLTLRPEHANEAVALHEVAHIIDAERNGWPDGDGHSPRFDAILDELGAGTGSRLSATAATLSPSLVANWEATKPWDATRDDLLYNRVSGITVGHARGSESASFENNKIVVKDEWFDYPTDTRRAILYHESGHGLESGINYTDKARYFGVANALDIVDLPGAQRFGYNPDEIIAQAYSVLWTEPQWATFGGGPEILFVVARMARENGWPLPSNTKAASLDDTAMAYVAEGVLERGYRNPSLTETEAKALAQTYGLHPNHLYYIDQSRKSVFNMPPDAHGMTSMGPSIVISSDHGNIMTVLHELAHGIVESMEGHWDAGHGPIWQAKYADLLREHISPACGDVFLNLMGLGTTAAFEGDRWVDEHRTLLADALYSWKGWPSDMGIHMHDAEHDPTHVPGSGSGKKMRAQAEALLAELAQAGPTSVRLYRGSHVEPKGWRAWSESLSVARRWAAKNGGQVWVMEPGQGRGLKVSDYISSEVDEEEREWIAQGPASTKTANIEDYDPDAVDEHGHMVIPDGIKTIYRALVLDIDWNKSDGQRLIEVMDGLRSREASDRWSHWTWDLFWAKSFANDLADANHQPSKFTYGPQIGEPWEMDGKTHPGFEWDADSNKTRVVVEAEVPGSEWRENDPNVIECLRHGMDIPEPELLLKPGARVKVTAVHLSRAWIKNGPDWERFPTNMNVVARRDQWTQDTYDIEKMVRNGDPVLGLIEAQSLANKVLRKEIPGAREIEWRLGGRPARSAAATWIAESFMRGGELVNNDRPVIWVGSSEMLTAMSVIHEVSHLVNQSDGDSDGHGPEWRAIYGRLAFEHLGRSPWEAAGWAGTSVGSKTASIGPIYRGFQVKLPDDLLTEIRMLAEPPSTLEEKGRDRKIGRLVVDWLQSNHWNSDWGLGRHWTTNKSWASAAAMQGGAYGGIGIILMATYDPAGQQTDLDRDEQRWAKDEGEIRLLPGAKVMVIDVEVRGITDKYTNTMDGPIQAEAAKSEDYKISWPRRFNDPFMEMGVPHRLSDNGMIYTAQSGGDTIGYLRLRTRLSDGVWEVWRIWVHEDHQRKGIASAMLAQARKDLGRVDHAPEWDRTNDGEAWSKVVGVRTASTKTRRLRLPARSAA